MEISNSFGGVYKGKKVLITGHTGFKGSWLTLWLLKLGAKVSGISKDIPTNPSMFEMLNIENKIEHIIEDVRNLEAITVIIERIKPDYIFHLAAQAIVSKSYKAPLETITSNVLGTANILEVLRVLNFPCHAVFITSDKCYDNVEWVWGYKETDAVGGKDIYSGSKGAAELMIKSYFHSFFNKDNSNVRLVSVRAGNVIGGGDWALDRIVPDCMRAWSTNQVIETRSPNATRPWQHVLEPLSGYLAIGQQLGLHKKLSGESFNFGPKSEYNHSVKELLEDLSRFWNFEKPELAYKITDVLEFHEAALLKLNCDKALFHLKWQATLDYQKLIEFTGMWYVNFYKGNPEMFDYTIGQIKDYEQIAINNRVVWSKQ